MTRRTEAYYRRLAARMQAESQAPSLPEKKSRAAPLEVIPAHLICMYRGPQVDAYDTGKCPGVVPIFECTHPSIKVGRCFVRKACPALPPLPICARCGYATAPPPT